MGPCVSGEARTTHDCNIHNRCPAVHTRPHHRKKHAKSAPFFFALSLYSFRWTWIWTGHTSDTAGQQYVCWRFVSVPVRRTLYICERMIKRSTSWTIKWNEKEAKKSRTKTWRIAFLIQAATIEHTRTHTLTHKKSTRMKKGKKTEKWTKQQRKAHMNHRACAQWCTAHPFDVCAVCCVCVLNLHYYTYHSLKYNIKQRKQQKFVSPLNNTSARRTKCRQVKGSE